MKNTNKLFNSQNRQIDIRCKSRRPSAVTGFNHRMPSESKQGEIALYLLEIVPPSGIIADEGGVPLGGVDAGVP